MAPLILNLIHYGHRPSQSLYPRLKNRLHRLNTTLVGSKNRVDVVAGIKSIPPTADRIPTAKSRPCGNRVDVSTEPLVLVSCSIAT
jgi:hypothetical protein